MDTDVLDWALADFAGSVAAAARYDGPCCMLSAVEKRGDKRLLSAVLDHAPDHEDIRAFRGRLHAALTARDVMLVGLTTAGAALSPQPLAEVCRGVPHHLGAFPVIAEVVQAVSGAVASARQSLTATQPTLPQGRPTTQTAKAAARQKQRLAQQRVALYPHRPLCVPHPRSPSARKRLGRSTRGLPQLRTLRELMAQVYALFDRRCRTQTALHTLDHLRRRLLRFTQGGEPLKKIFSPTLEKALTLLDDKRLPSTSHAVERGNRRYRKRHKQVYRVRTQAQIRARLALDMWREAQGEGRHHTLHTLHEARAG
jgi:hypothetical protein